MVLPSDSCSVCAASEIPIDAYSCACIDGYANGLCAYDEVVQNYTDACDVRLSTSQIPGGGNCDVDVDECASNPCTNGATCYDHISNWTCDCTYVLNNRTGIRRAFDGERCENEIDVCAVDEDDCDPINAVCTHLGPGLHHCECNIGWEGDGAICTDVDECASRPCQNGAACYQSLFLPEVLIDAYRCVCTPGFTDGLCLYDFVDLYEPTCSHLQSDASATGGNCNFDVDECLSEPCQHGAVCSQSSADGNISHHAYRCTCPPGFANGECGYANIVEYDTECTVTESSESAVLNGNCDIDVDECASSPCANGGTCSDSNTDASISVHTYRCTCVAGFANGWCVYDFIAEYTTECTVFESDNNTVWGGNCDVDVDECASFPCQNNATCSDSTSRLTVAPHDYRCTCGKSPATLFPLLPELGTLLTNTTFRRESQPQDSPTVGACITLSHPCWKTAPYLTVGLLPN